MYFVKCIRFGQTLVLIQIAREDSRKSDIDQIVFNQNHPSGQKMIKNSYQTIVIFSESYWQTILQSFPDFISSNNTDIFRK